MDAFVSWTKDETILLIEEYKKFPILYKTTHPDFAKQNKKYEALAQICEALRPRKSDVTIDTVRRKMKMLVQKLNLERRKMNAFARRGGKVEKFQSQLWCFKKLSFLLKANNHDAPQAESNIDFIESSDSQDGTERENNDRSLGEPTSRLGTNSDNNNEVLEDYVKKSSELMVSILKNSQALQSKEELFCSMLLESLHEIVHPEIYDAVTMEIFQVVRKSKTKERELIEKQKLLREITSINSEEDVNNSNVSNLFEITNVYENNENEIIRPMSANMSHNSQTIKVENDLIFECKQEEEEILIS